MENAAVTIQAAFRGFHVRQCQPLRKLRQIADVRTKLKKLNMRVSDPIYVDKLCSDPVENGKVKEEIMALLLELDAIQGMLPVVRKIRKSVTRHVVQFQEIVDAVQVDPVARNDAEEGNPRPSGQANSLASEQANPRPVLPANPSLRRVMSLDDNVYPEQSYAQRAHKKASDCTGGDGSNRSSDEDGAPRRRPERWGKNPFLQRSMSGNQRTSANKGPLFSEVQRNAGTRNPLMGRSISEVVRKPTKENPLLGRSISEVQRKKSNAVSSSPATTVPDDHRTPNPKTPPISDARVISLHTNSPPPGRKLISFDREEAAIRIQSTFRGHLSRRSRPLQHLRNISLVNTRLRELNRQLADPICGERLRMDEMERLKWSEEITALLLKLDSVQGVVQAIRDIRKSVTRDVIKLQEKVDSIMHEADILSRMAHIQSDSSTASIEQCSFGLEISDQESLDNDGGKEVVHSSPKTSASFDVIVGDRHAQEQRESHLWDDKFMNFQKLVNFEQVFDGSTGSCPCEKGNYEADLQPGQARVHRKLKRVPSESVESRFRESQNAFEIQQSDTLSSGSFPTEDGGSLILSSSVSAAGTDTDGKQLPLLRNGGVDCQHPLVPRIQKKLKTVEKDTEQNGDVTSAVKPDTGPSAAGQQEQLTKNPNGHTEKSADSVLGCISQAVETPPNGVPTAMGYYPRTFVHSTVVPSVREGDESSPSQRRLDGNSNDATMLPDEEFHSDREQQGCHNGGSPPRCLPEERAWGFLRSRGGRCEGLQSRFSEVYNGQTAQDDHLPTTCEAPTVHRPSEDQWGVNRLTALMDENARLKLLLSQVLEHAEDQAHDLKVTKRRLAILEKERMQYMKREDTAVRKKNTLVRRRR